MASFLNQENILFGVSCIVLVLISATAVLWRFRQTPYVRRVLKERNITLDRIKDLTLKHYYTQSNDQVISGSTHRISQPEIAERILSELGKTKHKVPGVDLVMNSELIIHLKNSDEQQRIGLVIDRNNEPRYVGPDYAIPSIELKEIIGSILGDRE